MPFDPHQPQPHTPVDSDRMRAQLNGLKNLIDAIPNGPPGPPGPAGPQGLQGPQGEVSLADLDSAIAGTSSNSNGVDLLNLVVSNPPTQAQMQSVADRLDELITALRR